MTFEYNGTKIFYKIQGSGESCLLLHGWGCEGSIFSSMMSQMPDKKFVIIDLPPFGKSDDSVQQWNIFTYANMVLSLCEHLNIRKCNVLGHSFGGRIGILLAALFPDLVNSLVLVDSAGLRPKRSLKYFLKVFWYKLRKKLGFSTKKSGSADYQNMPQPLKKLFVNIVNQHLDEYCFLISAPTLILFGKNDKQTPIYMARRLNRLIKNSELVLLDDAGHYSFLDSPLVFLGHLQKFWEEV